MRSRRAAVWRWAAATMLVGCSGDGPPLPEWLTELPPVESTTTVVDETTGVDVTTVVDATTVGGTTAIGDPTAASSTGPQAECGNGRVEDGEDCDGPLGQGATCESLGYAPGTLSCTRCEFDVTGCGPFGMVLVPGGVFTMGSSTESSELPIRQVTLDAFWIDAKEVTVDAYAACVFQGGGCGEPSTGSSFCNWEEPGREGHPMNCVRWLDAAAYCTWVDGGTKRLPTEAEWEMAARGTDTRTYPWGDSPQPSCTRAVMHDASVGGFGCGRGTTMPGGSKPLGVSPYGVHDMAGNVSEFVADWYGPYSAAETDNPTGPATGTERVARGGSLLSDDPNELRAPLRVGVVPTTYYHSVGFRCVKTVPLRREALGEIIAR